MNSLLIGDSLGNVILGYEDTLSVTMEDMITIRLPWRVARRECARDRGHALHVLSGFRL